MTQQGWQCPACGTVHAPSVQSCGCAAVSVLKLCTCPAQNQSHQFNGASCQCNCTAQSGAHTRGQSCKDMWSK